jgi:hypothetical protein
MIVHCVRTITIALLELIFPAVVARARVAIAALARHFNIMIWLNLKSKIEDYGKDY